MIKTLVGLIFDLISLIFQVLFKIISFLFNSLKTATKPKQEIKSPPSIKKSDIFRSVKDLLKEKNYDNSLIELNKISLKKLNIYDETIRLNYLRRTYEGLKLYNTAFHTAVMRRLFFILGRQMVIPKMHRNKPEYDSRGTIFFPVLNEDKEFKRIFKKCSYDKEYGEFLAGIDELLGLENDILGKIENSEKSEFRDYFR